MGADNFIPRSDHVLRHVGATKIEDNIVDGSAFVLREGEDGLSVEWRENAGANLSDQLVEIRAVIRRSRRKSHRLVEINVGETYDFVHDRTQSNDPKLQSAVGLSFMNTPLPADAEHPREDPFHSEILGTPVPGSPLAELVGDLIASCTKNLYPAVGPDE